MTEPVETPAPEKDCAVCFIEELAEELVEVDALRKKRGRPRQRESREWKDVKSIAEEAGKINRDDKTGEVAAKEAGT